MIRNAASLGVIVILVFAVASCSSSNNISFTNASATVSISTPWNNSTRDGIVDVKIDATDQEGITNVELYANNILIAQAAVEPFNFRWDMSSIATGTSATLVARVIDVFGAVTNSASVKVTRGTAVAPTITLTSPTTGTTVKQGDPLTLTASATDPKDGVLTAKDFSWNSSLQGDFVPNTAGQFKGLVIGVHLITLTATNSNGVPASKSVTVTVQPNTGNYAYIPAGTYSIGQPFAKSKVTLTRSILMAKKEFTVREMIAAQIVVFGTAKTMWSGWANGRNTTLLGDPDLSPNGYLPPLYMVKNTSAPLASEATYGDYPAVFIAFYEACLSCNALSKNDGLQPAYSLLNAQDVAQTKAASVKKFSFDQNANGWRLPTEAEWEVAARGGLVGKKFPWGDQLLLGGANTRSDATLNNPLILNRMLQTGPMIPGLYDPNAFGLYDIAGNVAEMCSDMYTGQVPFGIDPFGVDASLIKRQVVKGGAWSGFLDDSQIGLRNISIPRNINEHDAFPGDIGFRVVRYAP